MSTQRVVTGFDDRGRPIAEWRQVTDDPGPAYGFMEPAHSAPVERRKATPEELAAADRVEPSRLTPRPASSYRPKPAPAIEEPTMTEPAAPDPTQETLSTLANAIVVAAEAWAAKVAAMEAFAATDVAWRQARAALDIAYRAFGSRNTAPIEVDAEILAEAYPRPRAVQPRRGKNSDRAEDVAARAQRVVEALERHGGNTKAAGAELGMRGNIVALIAKRAAKRDAASA